MGDSKDESVNKSILNFISWILEIKSDCDF